MGRSASSTLSVVPAASDGAPFTRKRWPPASISGPRAVIEITAALTGWPAVRGRPGISAPSASG